MSRIEVYIHSNHNPVHHHNYTWKTLMRNQLKKSPTINYSSSRKNLNYSLAHHNYTKAKTECIIPKSRRLVVQLHYPHSIKFSPLCLVSSFITRVVKARSRSSSRLVGPKARCQVKARCIVGPRRTSQFCCQIDSLGSSRSGSKIIAGSARRVNIRVVSYRSGSSSKGCMDIDLNHARRVAPRLPYLALLGA